MINIATKSVNMSDIIVYLAMFSASIDKILCFVGPHKLKMRDYQLSGNWDVSDFRRPGPKFHCFPVRLLSKLTCFIIYCSALA